MLQCANLACCTYIQTLQSFIIDCIPLGSVSFILIKVSNFYQSKLFQSHRNSLNCSNTPKFKLRLPAFVCIVMPSFSFSDLGSRMANPIMNLTQHYCFIETNQLGQLSIEYSR